jgi:hypothetical protein
MNDLVDKVNDELVCLTSSQSGLLYTDNILNSRPQRSVLGQMSDL